MLRPFLKILPLMAVIFLFPTGVFAMSATNVQPANLIQSNRTTVTVTFTTAAALPANGKVKIIFPAGFNVTSASGGACSTMNGGFGTSVSSQTVTITRDNTGTVEPIGVQTCTINLISNPSATGSTGTYTIQITDSTDTVLDQDTAVTADTIVVPGIIAVANVQPDNQVANVMNGQTVTFTSLNTLTTDGKIAVTFPAGFNVAGASNPACSTMDGGFTVSTSGQTVVLTRNGAGTVQTAGAESCTFRGIVNPGAGSTTTFYQIQTRDGLDNATDATSTIFVDPFFAAPSLTTTNVQPTSLIAGASSIVTVTFTTVTTTPIGAMIRVTFPFDFDLSHATSVDCSSIAGSETFTTSSQTLTIQTSMTASEAAGAESCIISNVRNPRFSGSTGTYAIELLDGAVSPVLISSDMAVAADTITAATLVGTDIIPENLIGSSTQLHTVSFTTVNPIPGNGKIFVTYPAGFDLSPVTSSTCSGLDGTISVATSGQSIILTRVGGTSSTAALSIDCMINDVRNRTTAGASGTYNVTTTNSLNTPIDWSTAAADTYIVPPALTVTNIQPVSLVQNVLSDQDIVFGFSQNLPIESRFEFIYGSGFNVTGTTVTVSCPGIDGGLTATTSGSIVTLTRNGNGTTIGPGTRTCRVYGIRNSVGVGTTLTYTINVKDKSGFMMNIGSVVTADTITAPGVLTAPDVTPASLAAGATTTATAVFGFSSGWPYDAKLAVVFPAAFGITPTSGSCAGLSGGYTASASGTNSFVITRDGSSTGTVSGSASCNMTSIKNQAVSGIGGTYSLVLYDSTNVTIASASVSGDTFTAGAITSANVQPDSLLINSTSTASVTFTASNPVPSDGKLSVNFPAGFGLTGVGASGMACSGLSGTLSTSVAGQTVTALRAGGSTTTESATFTCTIANVRSPVTAGAGGTYIIRTLTNADVVIDENASVASDTFSAAGTLTSLDVSPSTLNTGASANHTITFTQALGIPNNGSVRITYPAGFTISGATGGTCSSMDGSFVTSVSGTQVIITRSGGTFEPAGAQTCTVNSIVNPSTAGSAGTYTITTTLSDGTTIESGIASSDTFSTPSSGGGGGGGGGGGSSIIITPTFQTSNDTEIRKQIEARLKTLPVAVHNLIKLADDKNPKTQEDSAVYYVGADGLRHAFPNSKVYFSWYCDFSSVTIVSPSVLASIGLGSNVTYRPGTRLVKFMTDNKVYIVTKGGVLRGIPSEAFALELLGPTWNKQIDDISDAFFTNYRFGPDATTAAEFLANSLITSVTYPSDSMRIVGNTDSAPLAFAPVCAAGTPATNQPTAAVQGFDRPTVIPAGYTFTANLGTNSPASIDIRYLQYVLIELGPEIYPEQRATGNFGPATELGVKNFQKSYGLSQTGRLDADTRAKLNVLIK